MKYACQYAIVRFMPFVETGEFANVGIVLMCPEANFFEFKLLGRIRRITAFFDQLEPAIYRQSRKDLTAELNRVKEYLFRISRADDKSMRFIFKELVRPREVMLRFDQPRTVLTNDPHFKLEELFSYYVERSFVTQEYVEQKLETDLRGLLARAQIRDKYEDIRVEHGSFNARFPFAHRNANGLVDRAIKPLNLSHSEPAAAYEHGWTWVGRLRQLKLHDVLPENVLITTQPPLHMIGDHKEVYEGLKGNFEEIGIQVIPITEQSKIEKFVREI